MTDALKRWVAERRRIAEAATPAPWSRHLKYQDKDPIANLREWVVYPKKDCETKDGVNATFIADARNHIETLLRIIEVQDAALERMDEANFNEFNSAAEARSAVEALLKEAP